MVYRGFVKTAIILGLFLLYYYPTAFQPTSVPELGRELVLKYEVPDTQTIVGLLAKYSDHKTLGPPLSGEDLLLDRYIMWHARSVCFLIMMFGEMANAYNCRSEYSSIFKIGFFSNRFMIWVVLFSAVGTIALYIPALRIGEIFKVIPLTPLEWLWIIPTIVLIFGSVEAMKYYFRQKLHLN